MARLGWREVAITAAALAAAAVIAAMTLTGRAIGHALRNRRSPST